MYDYKSSEDTFPVFMEKKIVLYSEKSVLESFSDSNKSKPIPYTSNYFGRHFKNTHPSHYVCLGAFYRLYIYHTPTPAACFSHLIIDMSLNKYQTKKT
jgi:hypothetical protein